MRALMSRSRITLLALAMTLASLPARASDRYRLDLTAGFQFDRFQSPAADSLGLSRATGPMGELAFDFRVLDAPMAGTAKPAVHLFGRVSQSSRILATDGFGTSASVAPVREGTILEMSLGAALHVPMELVDKEAGASLYVSYEGGLGLAAAAGEDFLRVKRLAVGFERTRGFFDGSFAELGYGHDDGFGRSAAAQRWSPRFRVQASLVPTHAPPPSGARGAPPPVAIESPVHAFADLLVATDGREGPDGVRAMLGITVNAGAILRRAVGAPE